MTTCYNFHVEELTQLLFNASKTGLVFITFNPEIIDFTKKECNFKISVFYSAGKFEFDVNSDKFRNIQIISILNNTIFSKEKTLICWNIKSFVSWVKFKFKKDFRIDCSFWDLKLLESFNGLQSKIPENFGEAVSRLKILFNSTKWANTKKMYHKIYCPLVDILSKIETTPLVNIEKKCNVYANYEILGQKNGRLSCSEVFENSFLAHNLKNEDKEVLTTRSEDEVFMSFDFKCMEIYVLAWLSKDKNLLHLIGNSKDLYLDIIKTIGKNDRDLCKKIFIPMIYGQSYSNLDKDLNISIDEYNKLKDNFSTAFNWLDQQQSVANRDKVLMDCFGKSRYFEEDSYKARNFSIQSPSATVCLEKLMKLSFVTDIAYNVYDEYVVYTNASNWKNVFTKSVEILEEESEIAPGLFLKVTGKGGKKLNNMKPFKRVGE